MISYSYLPQQFSDMDAIFAKMRATIERGDYTLGRELALFEEEFAQACGVDYAVGVNSGTDALFLSLKALGIKGDVITPPYSFYATTAAIVHAGAKPVFADVGYDFNIDPAAIEAAITPNTEAIVPVHWAGRPCNMEAIQSIANRHGLAIVEDAAQAFGAKWQMRSCGTWGDAGAFSLHPLKTLNVWGDGGVVVSRDAAFADKIRKMRNHGLAGRDECEFWGWNSRLDTLQAVVGRHVLPKVTDAIAQRRANAKVLDAGLAGISGIEVAPMPAAAFATYYLYTFRAKERDRLVAWLGQHGIDVKVHYPVPLHLHPAAAMIGHKRGDFPVAEQLADETLTLPAHEYVTADELKLMSDCVFALFGSEAKEQVAS